MNVGSYAIERHPLVERLLGEAARAADGIRSGHYTEALAILEHETRPYPGPPRPTGLTLSELRAWNELTEALAPALRVPEARPLLEIACRGVASLRDRPEALVDRRSVDTLGMLLRSLGLVLIAEFEVRGRAAMEAERA